MGAIQAWRAARRLSKVPVVTLMPHSRCNCRCVMCDIWKANRSGTSLPLETIERLVEDFRALSVRWVVLSGGEALMHPNLWALCEALKRLPLKITLLSSGLLLARHAEPIARWCDEVIVSLDGPPATHDRIRGVKGAFGAIEEGVAALRRVKPAYPVSARSVIQHGNFRELSATIEAARAAGLDHVSFLAADLSSGAFNRPDAWDEQRTGEVGLSAAESEELVALIEQLIDRHKADIAAKFIQESPAKLRRIAAHYRAANGLGDMPEISCNAPWVSAVIEADGAVRPCFFHAPIGHVGDGPLPDILNSPRARAFRATLDMARDPVCRSCVCTLKL
ncbi:MAG TPA: radical SAM protein [Magnetospirillaceae bacterium]|nr:radical SAM protein [Magnetospirillaceae bacterium]